MLIAPNFYNQADQNIYNQGYSFIPQERFRGGAFNVPTTPESSTGITTLPTAMNMGGSGDQGGYNPYTPNNNVRTDFIPNTEFRQFQDFGNLTDAQLSTKDRKFMDNFPEYYGINTGVPETGIKGFLNQAINFIPGVGTLKRGAEFLGGILKNKMPINQRAILENQLRGSGVLTDDIGRIALGQGMSYNTPEGIMAGYNANQMTDKTFDKRTGNISQSLQDKTSLTSDQINDIVNEIATTGKYSGTLTDEELGVNNLFSNLINVNLAKYNFKNTQQKAQQIAQFKEAQRIQSDLEAAAAAKSKAKALAAIKKQGKADYNPNIHGQTNYGQDSQGNQSFSGDSIGASGLGFGIGSDGGPVSNKTGRGRTGYMGGGLTNLVDIYD
jgi:hypothetical protein